MGRMVAMRVIKGAGWLLAVLLVAVGAWALVPAQTAEISGANAIAEVRRVELGGFEQTLLLRGTDRDNPVLLYVHGGPGAGQLPVAPAYSAELERRFVVVHWDQRGSGASCAGVDWSTLSLEQIVADTIELSELLGRGRRIFILGHSWGSLVATLAAQRRPDLYYAYIGMGQLVDRDRQEQISYDWVVAQARAAGDAEALKDLASIRPPYTSQAEFSLQRRWLSRYHGDVYDAQAEAALWPYVYFGPEYTVATRLRHGWCFDRSLEALLQDRLHVNLIRDVPRLEVPVVLLAGRHDYNTPFALVEEWAQRLQAPSVQLIWFEGAGHMIPFERPSAFQQRLLQVLPPLAAGATSGG